MDDIYSTAMLNERIQVCEDIKEFKKEVLEKINVQREQWKEKLNSILEENQYTKTKFAELCSVSRVAVNKWFNGAIPRQRELFIRIGFAANYGLEDMNRFLMRYGRFQGLYSKTLEDCVCIFVLSSDELEHNYATYKEILNFVKEKMDMCIYAKEDTYETSLVMNRVLSINSQQDLVRFIDDNALIFKKQYHRFYNYVLDFLKVNKIGLGEDKQTSTHFMANGQGWSSSLRHCVSAINQKKWYPIRDKVISLGLHLNMDIEQINEMLMLANMEPLCAKNVFESIIIYALENAKLEDVIFCDGTDSLCIYVREVFEKLDIEECKFFLDELSESY